MSWMIKSVAVLGLSLILDHHAMANSQIPLTQPVASGELEQENANLTCGDARDLLLHRGYSEVEVRSCFTFAFSFTVVHGGKSIRVFVDPQNGRSWHG